MSLKQGEPEADAAPPAQPAGSKAARQAGRKATQGTGGKTTAPSQPAPRAKQVDQKATQMAGHSATQKDGQTVIQQSATSPDAVEKPTELTRWQQQRPKIRRAVHEILLVAVLFIAYKAGRIAADGHVTEALDNARDVWNLERTLHLPSEYVLQHAALAHHWLIRIANCYYAYVHFPATAACLVWMWVKRPAHYLRTRRSLAWLTAAALVVHLAMPLAPPRMLTAEGMVDTGRLFGPAVYGSPTTDTLSNQYAAMPSLHVGWALAVAIALISATKSRWRWLWLLHPILTLLVVVVTGNHYWVDAIVASALLAVVLVALPNRNRAAAAIPRPRLGES